MILEHAILDVKHDEGQRFEAAFQQAQTIIAAVPGFRSLRLERCLETPSRYLLLVEWERLEDHTEGFRGSAADSPRTLDACDPAFMLVGMRCTVHWRCDV